MVTTGSAKLHERLRRIINSGQSRKNQHATKGYDYQMTNIAAAIGRVQLSKLEGFIAARQETAIFFNDSISVPGIITPETAHGRSHVWYQYTIQVTEEAGISRGRLMEALQERGIGTAINYPVPLHRQPIFEWMRTGTGVSCPVADMLADTVLSLPVYPA